MLSGQEIADVINSRPMEPGKRIRIERDKRGWSQADLARRAGVSQVAIKKIEAGQTRKSKFLPNIAQVLDVPLSELDASIMSDSKNTPHNLRLEHTESLVARPKNGTYIPAQEKRPPDSFPATDLVGEARDLPVYGTAQAGKGAMALSNNPVDWTNRPTSLLKVSDAYGIIVEGDSMAPAIKAGFILCIHPHKKARTGNYCIFRSENVDGSFLLCVKEYVKETQDHWHVLQYSPKKSFTLKKSEWQSCHVVVSIDLGG